MSMLRLRAIKATVWALLLFAILIAAEGESFAGEQLIGTSCSGNTNNVDWDTIGQCVSSTFQRVSPFLAGSIAVGATSLTSGTVLDLGSNTSSMLLPVGTTGQEPSPATAGMIRWNSTTLQVEAYNATAWASLVQTQTTPVETAPSGSGYFVMSGTTWNGDFGSRAAADSDCYTELSSTYTGWQGHSTAVSRGYLIAANVHAFLCDNTTCTNLMPNTTYYFASAANSSAGGAYFTTDSSGLGPNDSSDWASANYFGGTYSYWANRGTTSATAWSNAPAATSGYSCGNWTYSTSANPGNFGESAITSAFRWATNSYTCNITLNLICFVNP